MYILDELEQLESTLIQLLVALALLPLGNMLLTVDRLAHLPDVGRRLLGQRHGLSALGVQQQQTIHQQSSLVIGQSQSMTDIVAVAAVLLQVLLVQADPLGQGLLVVGVGGLDAGVTLDTKDRGAEAVLGRVGRVEVAVDEMLLPGVGAEEVVLAGEVALDGLGLGELEGLARGGGLVHDGEAVEGGEFLLDGPVL